ncbi:MAG: mannitol dehydrogenase family protein [Pseudomonadota bacterium]
MTRLSALDQLPAHVARPGFDRAAHGVGIVHLGVGAFHKAHQAVYTDASLGAAGGDWRIFGVNLRSTTAADQLGPQNGLFTVVERGADGDRVQVVGALDRACTLGPDRAAVMAALLAPTTRIVSLTVSEKGYGLDRSGGGVDPAHPAIAADLVRPEVPVGVAGLLVRALVLRCAAGTAPFTVLSCDNLPENGAMVRALLTDFAARTVPQHVDFIANEVAFPSTMVDRITPATTADTLSRTERLIACCDEAAVETEPFSQWVIEDRFTSGRPAWDAGGAIFTGDTRPFEAVKLGMLNGTHSLMAYVGFLCAHRYVRDVMSDDALAALVRRHMSAAAATLEPPAGLDLAQYAVDLATRFANPAIAHETYQIAMDGSQKMPQRVFAPAVRAIEHGAPVDSFAFVTAAWLRYCLGRNDAGETYQLRDPLEGEWAGAPADAAALFERGARLGGVMPDALTRSDEWRRAVVARLAVMVQDGMPRAVHAQLQGAF